MINKSKCFKISLVALLLSSTFTDGMQVMASTIRNSEGIPADVQMDSNTQDNVEQDQEPVFVEDSTEVEEKQSSDVEASLLNNAALFILQWMGYKTGLSKHVYMPI